MSNNADHLRDPSLKYITLAVLLAHAGLLLLSYVQFEAIPIPKPKEYLVVKTIELDSRPSSNFTAQASSKPSTKPKSAPIPAPAPEPEPELEPEPEPEPIIIPEPEPIMTPEPVAPEPVIEKKKEPEKPKEKKTAPHEKEIAKKSDPKKTTDKKTVAKTEPKTEPKKEVKKAAVTPKKEEKKPVAKADPAPKKTPEKKKEPATPTPTVAAKKPEKKKSETPPSPPKENAEEVAAKKAAVAKQQALLKSAKESIAKIDKSHHNFASNEISSDVKRYIPERIDKLQIDALPSGGPKSSFTLQEASYSSELISRLRLLLRLPEYGDVKVNLTLERSGRVAKIQIISAQSPVNKKYIEKKTSSNNFSRIW